MINDQVNFTLIAFCDLIKYIYSGEITLSVDNSSKLIEISNYLQMKVLAELCDKYITDYLYFKSFSHQMM